MRDRTIINVFTMMVVFLVGCATMDTRWQQANSKNTVEAYEAFLQRYPDSHYVLNAKEKIESLHWNKAIASNTIQGFERYMKLHSDGRYVGEAKERIESLSVQEREAAEQKAFDRARKLNSYASYTTFLSRYPDGRFTRQAQSALKDFARVIIDFPSSLKSRSSYYNISGPVWVYKIQFREVNGVGVKIDRKSMTIGDGGPRYWTDSSSTIHDSETQKNVVLNIPPNGSASYTSWVNSPNHELTGKTMHLQYDGIDDNGHPVHVEVRFRLVE